MSIKRKLGFLAFGIPFGSVVVASCTQHYVQQKGLEVKLADNEKVNFKNIDSELNKFKLFDSGKELTKGYRLEIIHKVINDDKSLSLKFKIALNEFEVVRQLRIESTNVIVEKDKNNEGQDTPPKRNIKREKNKKPRVQPNPEQDGLDDDDPDDKDYMPGDNEVDGNENVEPENDRKDEPVEPKNPSDSGENVNPHQPDSGQTKKINQNTNKKHVRIASWNVKNYGDKTLSKNPVKAEAVASVIFANEYDLVGLTELDGPNVPNELVKKLNELEKKNRPNENNIWKSLISDDYPKGSADKKAAFLYKDNIISPLILNNNKYYTFYNGDKFELKFGGTENKERKAPFIAKFGSKVSGYENVNFTYAISHFDGPGVKKDKGEKSMRKGNGSFEFNEAWNIKNVFDWMKTINGGDDDLIFQGDTNIKKGNENRAFGWVGSYENAKMVLNEQKDNTSLGKNMDKYSQPYDKIIHSSNLKFTNPQVFHLYDLVKNPNIFQYSSINSINDWVTYFNSKSNSYYNNEWQYVYDGVSDHCPISYDLILDANDPK
ncbi:lipoprotein [Mycoplasmopsis californica]|uniref:Lipoprotein n=1 Tax=Mycoplasmopsis californica TaxID=2113 RepID=A0A059XX48_9BACT|nr:hypothetical protein [Mycoplasmopsis californica]AIA29772.1 lipoprotein [Mycoplasmopsis californica]